jgi:hypothetical protein
VRRLSIVFACLVIAVLTVPMSSMAAPRRQSESPRQESRFLNPNLAQVAQVPGSTQDVSATRVLCLDTASGSPTLKVRDRGTGVDTPSSGAEPADRAGMAHAERSVPPYV